MKPKPSDQNEDRQIAQRTERWALWALPIGFLGIVVSALCTAWAIHRSEAFAIETAEHDKPKVALYIEGKRIEEPLTIYYAGSFIDRSLTVDQLPITVVNEGEKSLHGLELLVRKPALSAVPNEFLQVKMETGLPISDTPERHFVQNGGFAYTSFSLPELHPGQAATLGEPLRVMSSQFRDTVDATTKDGVPVRFDVSMTISLPVQVSIAGEDLHTQDFDLDLMGVKANSLNDLFLHVVEMQESERQRYRKKTGFVRYWLNHLTPAKRNAILLAPAYDTINGSNGERVDLAKGSSAMRTMAYSFP